MSEVADDRGAIALTFALLGLGLGWVVFTPRGNDLMKACAAEGFKGIKGVYGEVTGRDMGTCPGSRPRPPLARRKRG